MPQLIPVDHDPFAEPQLIPVDHDPWQAGVDQANAFDRPTPEITGQDRARSLMMAMGRAGGDLQKNAPLLWDTAPGRMVQGVARFARGETPVAGPGLRREDYTDDPNARQPIEPMIHDAMNVADVMSLGGMPMAKAGAAGIFGGRLAVTADHQALNRAEALAKAGAPKEQIWNETGWFRGADDKWRFEIPDKGAMVSPGVGSWKDHVEHPDFFKAYPQMGKKTASIDYGDAGGAFYGNIPNNFATEMRVTGPSRDSMTSTSLHEMQHGIQETENFARGSSPMTEGRLLRENTGNPIIEQLRSAVATGQYGMPGEKSFMEAARNLRALEEQSRTERSISAYRRVAGEVEARNVQTRMDMTPEQRRAKPPWTTEDVPRGQQIVRNDAGPPSSIMSVKNQKSTADIPGVVKSLQEALSHDNGSNFPSAFAGLKELPASDLVAIAKEFSGRRDITSGADALKKIWNRHQQLEIMRDKVNFMKGRSAG